MGVSLCALLATHNVAAAGGVISFQGKLTNPDGTNVVDGSYSIRFRIYTDSSADAVNSCLLPIPANGRKYTERWTSMQDSFILI